MADPTFTRDTELRLQAIETAMTQLWELMQNVINKEQFNRLNVIRQKQVTQIEERVSNLTDDITELQEQISSLL